MGKSPGGPVSLQSLAPTLAHACSRATLSKGSKHIQLRGDIFLKDNSPRGFSGDLDDDNVNALLFISVILGTLSLLRNNRLPQGTNRKAGPLFFGANHLAES